MSDINTAALVEKMSRAMCAALGQNPDEIRTIGYGEHEQTIPYWKMQVEWALRIGVAIEVLRAEGLIRSGAA